MALVTLRRCLLAASVLLGAVLPHAQASPGHDVAPGLLALPVYEVPDVKAASAFFATTLGLKAAETRHPDASTTQVVMRTGEASLDGLVVQRDRRTAAPAGGCISMTGTCGADGHGRYNRLQIEINPITDVVPTALRFQQAGGQLLAVLNSASGYTVAFVTDPWGNAFELYNYQPQHDNQRVRIANVDLYVTDLERSVRFYQRVFGLYVYPNDRLGSNGATIKQLVGTSPTDTSSSERVLSFFPDHMEGVVVMGAGGGLGVDPSYRYSVVTVDDVRAVLARARAAGGRVVRQPAKDTSGHLVARMTDQDGNLLELREAPARERRL